ncbi:unnamed protein product [Orchesella dallaii]|uniref:Retrovirus-related Pol polyprotein from transposon TNT 1-94-like beta-barrel domain-containing protein n=1 Tax=Orchesella dallaii TaxID=48710 RepID=A0ABP1RGK6_9HEXA
MAIDISEHQNPALVSDSGATHHITGRKDWFISYEPFTTEKPVYLTDQSKTKAKGEGTNSVPLLWRRGTTLVTSGHYHANLLVKFVSPCSMLRNGTVHQDLTDVVYNKCEEIYNELFLDEIEIMCPKSYWSDFLDRQRRAIFGLFILGIIAVAQVVAAGLGVAGFAVSVSNANTLA